MEGDNPKKAVEDDTSTSEEEEDESGEGREFLYAYDDYILSCPYFAPAPMPLVSF